jgi:hypothetical protein
MRERTARKIISGWSAFTFGMKRQELTVLVIGEWDRPSGKADWGVAIRDLRTGYERLVFDEQEWERIKSHGLPPVGVDWVSHSPPSQVHPRLKRKSKRSVHCSMLVSRHRALRKRTGAYLRCSVISTLI